MRKTLGHHKGQMYDLLLLNPDTRDRVDYFLGTKETSACRGRVLVLAPRPTASGALEAISEWHPLPSCYVHDRA
jgi:hypothetical protein